MVRLFSSNSGTSGRASSALTVIERVLGAGGSSRFFQRWREEERVIYNVTTAIAAYKWDLYFAQQKEKETLDDIEPYQKAA